MPALTTTTETYDHGTIIALAGEIDLVSADRFYEDVMTAARTPGARVVLDCRELDFIDSSGLRALIKCYKASRQLDSHIVVAAPRDRVAQILHLTGIDRRLSVYPSLAEARQAPAE